MKLDQYIEFNGCPSDCNGGQHVGRACSYIIAEAKHFGLKIKVHAYPSQHKNRELAKQLIELALSDIIENDPTYKK